MSDFPEMVYKATEAEEVLPEVDAHGYVQGVYRGTIKPNGSRLKAAIAALPFERAKLAMTALTTPDDLADRLQRALAEQGKIIEGRAMKVIEHKKLEAPKAEPLVTAEDMAKPMTRLDTARFRRL